MAEGFYILSDEDRRKFAKIVSKSWTDAAFAERYDTEPYVVLDEHGIDYPAAVAPPLVPPKPTGDLSLEAMEAIAAGIDAAAASTFGSASSISTIGGCAFTASTLGSASFE